LGWILATPKLDLFTLTAATALADPGPEHFGLNGLGQYLAEKRNLR
jgi:hypothetical protein